MNQFVSLNCLAMPAPGLRPDMAEENTASPMAENDPFEAAMMKGGRPSVLLLSPGQIDAVDRLHVTGHLDGAQILRRQTQLFSLIVELGSSVVTACICCIFLTAQFRL